MEHSRDRAEIRQILLTAGFESRGFVGIFLGDELFTKIGNFRKKTDPHQESCSGELSAVNWPSTWPFCKESCQGKRENVHTIPRQWFLPSENGGIIHPDVAASIKYRDDQSITHGALSLTALWAGPFG
jgi:hypothetical protein